MNNRYENGKIYKIVDNGFNKMYIGSTTQELSQRMTDHRKNYKNYLRGKYQFVSIFLLFDEFGVENCRILLLESCPCENRMELYRKEGEYIKDSECINKVIAGRTDKEYRIDNKDRIKEWHDNNKDKRKTKYYENRDVIRQKYRIYYQVNREKIIKQKQDYQSLHKEEINEYRKTNCECLCGGKYTKQSQAAHNKTKKHILWLNNNN